MLPVVSADTIYAWARSMEESNKQEEADEFWEYLKEENPVLHEYVVGFTEVLKLEDSRSFFLNGVYTAIALLKRQDDAEMLEKQFGE